jgi:hypothetical protein
VTVTKTDHLPWENVKPAIADAITEFFASGEPIVTDEGETYSEIDEDKSEARSLAMCCHTTSGGNLRHQSRAAGVRQQGCSPPPPHPTCSSCSPPTPDPAPRFLFTIINTIYLCIST